MRLAIADPPYPPQYAERRDLADGGTRLTMRSRARRWYGDGPRDGAARPADFHPDAGDWDNPVMHKQLLEALMDEYDGWALATCPDGLGAYYPLPPSCKLLVWRKLRPMPTASRVANTWEPVIVRIPEGRRSVGPMGQLPDVLEAAPPSRHFAGAKPAAWTRWVLDVLAYDPDTDTLDDLFPGSGAVAAAAAQGVLL